MRICQAYDPDVFVLHLHDRWVTVAGVIMVAIGAVGAIRCFVVDDLAGWARAGFAARYGLVALVGAGVALFHQRVVVDLRNRTVVSYDTFLGWRARAAYSIDEFRGVAVRVPAELPQDEPPIYEIILVPADSAKEPLELSPESSADEAAEVADRLASILDLPRVD